MYKLNDFLLFSLGWLYIGLAGVFEIINIINFCPDVFDVLLRFSMFLFVAYTGIAILRRYNHVRYVIVILFALILSVQLLEDMPVWWNAISHNSKVKIINPYSDLPLFCTLLFLFLFQWYLLFNRYSSCYFTKNRKSCTWDSPYRRGDSHSA